MAYNAAGLKLVTHGATDPTATPPVGALSIYHYATADAEATVTGSNYFNSASTILNVGDLINCTFGCGATLNCRLLVVSSNSGGTVGVTASLTT